jgi:hypothetical protein
MLWNTVILSVEISRFQACGIKFLDFEQEGVILDPLVLFNMKFVRTGGVVQE